MEDSLELAARGSVSAQIQESYKMVCKCKTNHWLELPPDDLEDLMISIRNMD